MKKIMFFVMSIIALTAVSCGSKTSNVAEAVAEDSVSVVTDSLGQVNSVEITVDSVEVAE